MQSTHKMDQNNGILYRDLKYIYNYYTNALYMHAQLFHSGLTHEKYAHYHNYSNLGIEATLGTYNFTSILGMYLPSRSLSVVG